MSSHISTHFPVYQPRSGMTVVHRIIAIVERYGVRMARVCGGGSFYWIAI